MRERPKERQGHPEQIAPEVRDHRDERPHVQCHVEGEPEPVLVEPEKILPEQEVPRTRHRQELREPLHDPEHYGL